MTDAWSHGATALAVKPPLEPELIDMHAVIAKTGLSRSSIYRAIDNAGFPKAVPMSSSRTGYGRRLFIRGEVDAWVQEQIAKRDATSHSGE